MFKVILGATALLLSTISVTAHAKEVILITPSICPIICEQTNSSPLSDNGIITALENALDDLGHHLVVDFDTAARSRVKTAMGMTDLTLGPPFELRKNSRLEWIPATVGTTPIMVIFHPNRPLQLNSMRDLVNYRLVWNQLIEVDKRFQPLFDAMKQKGNLIMLPTTDFERNGLRQILNGNADVMMISQARYEDGLRRLRSEKPSASFRAFQAKGMPGYDISLALSTKTSLSKADQQYLIDAIQEFAKRVPKPEQLAGAATSGQVDPMAQLLKALASDQPLPPAALAKIKQIPAAMLDQIGQAKQMSPQALAKLKQLHASLQQ